MLLDRTDEVVEWAEACPVMALLGSDTYPSLRCGLATRTLRICD